MSDIAQLSFRVDSRQLDAADQKLNRLAQTSKRTETATEKMNRRMEQSVSAIRKLIGAYAGLQGVRVLIQMADQYNNINARLKIATRTQDRFNVAQRETFAIAQRSSVALGATATLYARVQRSVDELGGSQKLALQLTETINQSFAVTGATAAESASGILQLAQALNKGKLNGDEFRSVMENAPRIVDALTKSLGVGKGALADMAEQGKLTAPALVKALADAKDEIAAEFATLPLTVERSLIQLKNAFTKTIGELDSGVGGTANLAKAIKLLADNLGEVLRAATLVGQVLLTVYGAKAISSLAAYVKAKTLMVTQSRAAAVAAKAEAVAQAQAGLAITRQNQAIAASAQLAAKATLDKATAALVAARNDQAAAFAAGVRATNEIAQARASIAQTAAERAAAAASIQLGAARTTLVGANAALTVSNQGLIASQKALDAAMVGSKASLFSWGNALNVVLAGVVAWEIGSWAREEFFVVARLGDDLVFGFMEGMNLLRDSAERAFAYFKDVATFAIKAVRGEIADMIDGMVSLSQVALPWYLKSSLTDNAAKELNDIAAAIRGEEVATSELDATLAELNKTRGENSAANRKMLADMRSATQATHFASDAVNELTGDSGTGIVGLGEGTERTAEQIERGRKTMLEFDQAILELEGNLGPLAKVYSEYIELVGVYSEKARKAIEDGEDETVMVEKLRRVLEALTKARDEDANALADKQNVLKRYLADLDRETELLGFTDRQKFIAQVVDSATEALIREGFAADVLNKKIAEMTPVLSRAAGAFFDFREEVEASEQAAEDFERIWLDASDSVADAIGDFASGGIDDFEDFADVLRRIANDLVSDLVSTFARDLFAGKNPFAGFGSRQTASSNLPSFLQGQGTGYGNYGSNNPFDTSQASTATRVGAFGLGAVGVYSAYQSGDPLSGAVSGASAGGVFGAVGSVVGAIIGGLAGLFGGSDKDPSVRFGGSGTSIRSPEGGFSTVFGSIQAGARQAGTDQNFEQFVGGIQDFDEAIYNMVAGLSDGEEQLTEIEQALAGWSIELEGSAATAENILGSRFETILGTFDANIQQFVRGAGDLESQVSALAQVLALNDLAESGQALLPTLDELLELIDATKKPGEELIQTYDRLLAATQALDQAFAITGTELDLTRAEFITFAADIAEAAGGLQRANELWATYFSEFYTEQELAQQRLTAATAARTAALTGLGLDSDISNQDFRTQFEELLPTLTAEEINQWLEASEAIYSANAAQEAYNATLEETVSVAPPALDALRDHLEALREARDEYEGFAAGLRRELSNFSMSEFEQEMRDIGEWTKDAIDELNRLAQAAGFAAASEMDLALVHEIAAARAAEAIARLRNAATSLVDQLYGNSGDDFGGQLIDSTQGFVDNALSGINQIGQATNALYNSQLAGVQRIQQWLDAQLIGDTSSLTPSQQLDETRRQLMEAFEAAMGGDADALNDITRLADLLLRQGQAFDPSDYPELEAFVRGLLGQLAELEFAEPPTGTGTDQTVGGGFGPSRQINPVVTAIDDGTQTISEERAALVAELFAMVRDLMEATGQSLGEVAASIGLNVQEFITDLGVNLDELTVETTMQLAGIASRLGISLEELATQVGVDLGQLSDAQSLLNQALGQTIEGLPEEDRRVLQPLFQSIAAATTATDANLAIAALTQAATAIGGDTALALQPFLDGIVIQTEIQTTNAHLDTLTRQGIDQLLELQNIVNELRGSGQGPGLPGTGGSGGGGLPGTGGLPGVTGSSFAFTPTADDGAVVAALSRIEGRLESLEATTADAGSNTVTAVEGEQAKRVRAAEQRADRLQANRSR